MKVGAGQYVSSNAAITTLPMMPPRRAATIDTATPVALEFIIDIIIVSTKLSGTVFVLAPNESNLITELRSSQSQGLVFKFRKVID